MIIFAVLSHLGQNLVLKRRDINVNNNSNSLLALHCLAHKNQKRIEGGFLEAFAAARAGRCGVWGMNYIVKTSELSVQQQLGLNYGFILQAS